MNQGRIIVITGAPGTGKTTTASVVAKESDLEKSVHMHTGAKEVPSAYGEFVSIRGTNSH